MEEGAPAQLKRHRFRMAPPLVVVALVASGCLGTTSDDEGPTPSNTETTTWNPPAQDLLRSLRIDGAADAFNGGETFLNAETNPFSIRQKFEWKVVNAEGSEVSNATGRSPRLVLPEQGTAFVQVRAFEDSKQIGSAIQSIAINEGLLPNSTTCRDVNPGEACTSMRFAVPPGNFLVNVEAFNTWPGLAEGRLELRDPAGQKVSETTYAEFLPQLDIWVWQVSHRQQPMLAAGEWTATFVPLDEGYSNLMEWDVDLVGSGRLMDPPPFPPGWELSSAKGTRPEVVEDYSLQIAFDTFGYPDVFDPFLFDAVIGYGKAAPADHRLDWQFYDPSGRLIGEQSGWSIQMNMTTPGQTRVVATAYDGQGNEVAAAEAIVGVQGYYYQPLDCDAVAIGSNANAGCRPMKVEVPAGVNRALIAVNPYSEIDPKWSAPVGEASDPTQGQLHLYGPEGKYLFSEEGHRTMYGTNWISSWHDFLTPKEGGQWTLAWNPENAVAKDHGQYALWVGFADGGDIFFDPDDIYKNWA